MNQITSFFFPLKLVIAANHYKRGTKYKDISHLVHYYLSWISYGAIVTGQKKNQIRHFFSFSTDIVLPAAQHIRGKKEIVFGT
jgi:hypothetical protein